MGKILLIEDEGTIENKVKKKLSNKNEVKHAIDCTSAIGLWTKYKGEFDCIILDLNINPAGLDEVEVNEYFPIHGILVLNKICDEEITGQEEKTREEKKEDIWKKTIVYSAYIDRLKERKRKIPNFEKEFPNFKDLILIRKEKKTSISDLIDAVTDFLK